MKKYALVSFVLCVGIVMFSIGFWQGASLTDSRGGGTGIDPALLISPKNAYAATCVNDCQKSIAQIESECNQACAGFPVINQNSVYADMREACRTGCNYFKQRINFTPCAIKP